MFLSRSSQKEREKEKMRDGERAVPCSQHAVIISLCGVGSFIASHSY